MWRLAARRACWVSALGTAGQIMGLETGLSFAQTTDPTQGQAGQIFGVFLGMMGVTLIFATGLHHMFIAGVAGSYDIIAPGAPPPVGDLTELAVDTVALSFRVGFQIAMPIIAAGLVFRVGLGVLARLIPQIQVFFVVLPLQLLGGFIVIALDFRPACWFGSIVSSAMRRGCNRSWLSKTTTTAQKSQPREKSNRRGKRRHHLQH